MGTTNWHADSWFAEHHADKLTEQFKAWWIEFYGPPEQYEGAPDEQDEYWVRCAFAWDGWNARISNEKLKDRECWGCEHWDPTVRECEEGWGPCISEDVHSRLSDANEQDVAAFFRKDFGCKFWEERKRPHRTD